MTLQATLLRPFPVLLRRAALVTLTAGLASAQTNIFTAADLIAIDADLAGDYILQADIDLDGILFDPIGSVAEPFTGTLEGNGYHIDNLQVFLPPDGGAGLFAASSGAVFSFVHLRFSEVTGFENVGTLVGLAIDSEFDRCTTLAGDLLGLKSVGGLVGRTAGTTMTKCRAKGNVEGVQRWAGGLVGHAHLGTLLSGCRSWGQVSGSESVGGLAGNLHASFALDCRSWADVSGDKLVGGLTGWMQQNLLTDVPEISLVAGCEAHGDVYGSSGGAITMVDPGGNVIVVVGATGGLVGWADDGSGIWDCASYGTVDGPSELVGPLSGGLVGMLESGGEIKDCNVYGDVLGGATCGGIAAWAQEDSSLENCNAYGDVFGVWQVGGFVGAFERAEAYDCHAFGKVAASGLGNNSFADPGRLIAAAGGLVGYTFPHPTEEFGSLLVRCSAAGSVSGSGQFTGGLIGLSWGTQALYCFASGDVYANDRRVGGLVGGVVSSVGAGFVPRSEFLNCYARGRVTQAGTDPGFDGMVGGLIGEFQTSPFSMSHLHRSYSSGKVTGTGTTGGLVGEAGDEYLYHASYWDLDASNQPTSALGEGLTTPEMFDPSNFMGWGFGGTWIAVAGDYPILFWQD